MSHFTVLVCLDRENFNKKDDVTDVGENLIESIMEPYSENLETEPREEDCYCMNSKAIQASRTAENEKFGAIDDKMRKAFWSRKDVLELTGGQKHTSGLPEEVDDKIEKLWTAHMREKEREEFRPQFLKDHPELCGPDPKCEECNGTGKRTTTYNQNSKWDWYTIGGRWGGMLNGKDSARAKEVKDMLEVDPKFGTFAVVTKDGEWVEKGKMGWWACVSDKNEKYKESFKEVIQSLHDEDVCVLVDCHI